MAESNKSRGGVSKVAEVGDVSTQNGVLSLKEKAVQSILWLGSAKLVGQGISWILTVLLIRILTPRDFGLVGMAAAYQAIVIIVYDLNLGSAIVQKSEVSQNDLSTCFWVVLGLGTLCYTVTWIFSPLIAIFFKEPTVINVLRFYAIGTLIESFHIVPFWKLSRELDFNKRAKAEFISNLGSGTFQLALAIAGFGVWSLVYGYIFRYLLLCVLIYWMSAWRPSLVFEYTGLREMLRFSLPLTGAKILRLISVQADLVIVGRFFAAMTVGYYRVGMELSRIPQDKIMTIINQVAYPTFSRLNERHRDFHRYFSQLTSLITVTMMPFYCLGVMFSREFISVVLSEKWLQADLVVKVFCSLGMLQALGMYFFMILNAKGRSRLNMKFNGLAATTLPLGILIGANWGIEGVCYSWLVVYPLLFCYLLYATLKVVGMGIRDFGSGICHPLFGTGIMSLVLMVAKSYVNANTLLGLVILCSGGVVIYLCYLAASSRETFKLAMELIKASGVRKNQ